jgi:hypothetical protein
MEHNENNSLSPSQHNFSTNRSENEERKACVIAKKTKNTYILNGLGNPECKDNPEETTGLTKRMN